MCDADRRRQRGRAEAVDGVGRHVVGKAGSERRPARDVAHPLVRHVDAARGDLFDLLGAQARALACMRERQSQQVVRTDLRQRTAIAPDRRPRAAEDHDVVSGHEAVNPAESESGRVGGSGTSRMLRASRIIWWVKPHSLSYQAMTLTSVPSTTLVSSRSMTAARGSPTMSAETSGSSETPSTSW